MRFKAVLVFAFFAITAIGFAQTHLNAPQPTTIAAAVVAKSSGEELTLTGVMDFGSIKQAFVEVAQPGEPTGRYTLRYGRKAGDMELVTLDAAHARVVLKYRGKIHELRIRGSSSSVSDSERQKDLSHSQYHTQRAKLEREKDEQLTLVH
jgi:hypothetical protein